MSGSAYDFPANPVVGDEYTTPNGITYQYSGKVWNMVSSSLEFGLGLKQTGLVVDLQPALPGGEIGGVIATARSPRQGLDWDTRGYVTAPLATHEHAGSIVEPMTAGVAHSRMRDPTSGLPRWVPNPDGMIFGIGLDDTTTTGTVHLQIAGRAATGDEIGGVRVPLRTPQQGLELDTQGFITAPLATHEHAGSIVDTPPDSAAYSRTTNAQGVSSWLVNPAALDFRIGLDDTTTPGVVDLKMATVNEIGGVKIIARTPMQGLEMDSTGVLTAPLATREHAGSITEPAVAGIAHGRISDPTTRANSWIPVAAATDYGIGLSLSAGADPGDNQIVNLTPAGLVPALLGGVWVPPRGELNGLEINDPANPGMLVAPPASDKLAGVITEPPVGAGQLWARTNSGTSGTPVMGKWEPVFNIGTLTYKGSWKPATNDPNIHAVANKQSGDFWVVDCVDAMIEETPPVGSTPGLDGVMMKEGDWVIYNADADIWNHIVRQGLNWGIGLEQTGLTVDLQQATVNELGGVKIIARSPQQGLAMDTTGVLTAPLATPVHAGSILEPPNDSLPYLRSTTGNRGEWIKGTGIYEWGVGIDMRDPNIVDLQPAKMGDGTNPPELGGVYATKRDDNQALALDTNGHISVPLATPLLAGAIVEPPNDDKGYVRTTHPNGVSQWVPPAESPQKIAGDTAPELGSIWIPDNRGLNLDDTGQVSLRPCSATALGGIFDAPMDAQQYVRKLGAWEPAQDVTIAVEPPANPTHGELWWDNDQGGLYIFYQDPTDTTAGSGQWVQINGSGGGAAVTATYGDVKSGFQPTDHAGWVKLDGRAVNTLTPGQIATATALGFTTNLPNATGSVALQNGTALGSISGSMNKTIAVANLPAHNMTAASAGASTPTSSSTGAHTHTTDSQPPFSMGTGPSRGRAGVGGSGYYYTDAEGAYHQSIAHTHVVASAGAHTHTVSVPAHTHTVALGGSGTALNVTPQSMSVNQFVFLGP